MKRRIRVKNLGLQPYQPVWQKMQQFTHQRHQETPSEIWIVEHPAVFTLGQAGKPEHVLNQGEIPLVQTDRGGQVTYHGPGQLVLYTLLNLHNFNIGVRSLVEMLENSVIDFLATHDIKANADRNAPGVYVDGKKIAALGLKIRKGNSYHGLSFNIDMDLAPFRQINPCGYQGLEVTQLRDQGVIMSVNDVATDVLTLLADKLDGDLEFND
ncbi:MAG: lipoyl(octanoyl) transferase LipB [Gammaproteobacteria bacterium]|nr:lipoyl(octanoyl) transferase LipB [Gammaproteobacteria bacterium]